MKTISWAVLVGALKQSDTIWADDCEPVNVEWAGDGRSFKLRPSFGGGDSHIVRADDNRTLVVAGSVAYVVAYVAPDADKRELPVHFYKTWQVEDDKNLLAALADGVEVTPAAHTMPILRLNAPSWYTDPGFLRWLNSPATATWHEAGTDPGDGSDAFFTFTSGEGGSDFPSTVGHPGIPGHIWEMLEAVVEEQLGHNVEVLVWVSNLES